VVRLPITERVYQAIAKALVLAQGGSIRVESSTEDRGTTFVLRFLPA
jgi:signal transduction histidine kinase